MKKNNTVRIAETKNNPFLGNLDLNALGDRLRVVDKFIVDVLATRLARGGLSDWVAENKSQQSEDGVYSKRRLSVETDRINLMEKWAKEVEINPNFARSLMYQIISESCLVQDEYMVASLKDRLTEKEDGQGKKKSEEEIIRDFLRINLLALTKMVAETYDDLFAEKYFGTKMHIKYSRKKFHKIISDLPNRDLAIDLGCATGIIAFEIAEQFKEVIGYDVSEDMIRVANSKKDIKSEHVKFIERDLEKGFKLEKNSVSFAVMNMGTASDIHQIENVISSLKKSLHPDGKFFMSFYNSESLMKSLGFLPWPMPMASNLDNDRRCLEVYTGAGVFFIYAKARTVNEVKKLFKEDFVIDDIFTYPSVASVLPQAVLENEDKNGDISPNSKARIMLKKIDRLLAESDINSGTYIMVTGSKK